MFNLAKLIIIFVMNIMFAVCVLYTIFAVILGTLEGIIIVIADIRSYFDRKKIEKEKRELIKSITCHEDFSRKICRKCVEHSSRLNGCTKESDCETWRQCFKQKEDKHVD